MLAHLNRHQLTALLFYSKNMPVTVIDTNMKASTTICIMAGITTNNTKGSNFMLRK